MPDEEYPIYQSDNSVRPEDGDQADPADEEDDDESPHA